MSGHSFLLDTSNLSQGLRSLLRRSGFAKAQSGP